MHPRYDEEDLVCRAQRGDREAFARLYETNVERVYHYLLGRMAEQADAEDVTAEVFLRAMEALPKYRAKGSPFIAWLLRIAHNQAINYMQKRRRRREEPLVDTLPARDDPAAEALRRAALNEVSLAMGNLTDLQRQVLSLRFAGELSISETAEVMKRNEGAVKFLQHSALRALRRTLGAQEAGGHG